MASMTVMNFTQNIAPHNELLYSVNSLMHHQYFSRRKIFLLKIRRPPSTAFNPRSSTTYSSNLHGTVQQDTDKLHTSV